MRNLPPNTIFSWSTVSNIVKSNLSDNKGLQITTTTTETCCLVFFLVTCYLYLLLLLFYFLLYCNSLSLFVQIKCNFCCAVCWHNIWTWLSNFLVHLDDTFLGGWAALFQLGAVGGRVYYSLGVRDNCNWFTRMQKRRKFNMFFFYIHIYIYKYIYNFFFYDKFVCIAFRSSNANRLDEGRGEFVCTRAVVVAVVDVNATKLRVRLHASAVFTRLKWRPQMAECQQRWRQTAAHRNGAAGKAQSWERMPKERERESGRARAVVFEWRERAQACQEQSSGQFTKSESIWFLLLLFCLAMFDWLWLTLLFSFHLSLCPYLRWDSIWHSAFAVISAELRQRFTQIELCQTVSVCVCELHCTK